MDKKELYCSRFSQIGVGAMLLFFSLSTKHHKTYKFILS